MRKRKLVTMTTVKQGSHVNDITYKEKYITINSLTLIRPSEIGTDISHVVMM